MAATTVVLYILPKRTRADVDDAMEVNLPYGLSECGSNVR